MLVSWLAIVGALIATALGQLTYKLFFTTKRRRHLIAAVAFFLVAPLCNYIALRQLSIGIVYMSTAVTQLLVLGLSRYVLKEKLTFDHAIAMLLIITGLILYNIY